MHIGTEWNETAGGTDSGATATHAAEASSGGSGSRMHFVTSISGHVDADSIITIESPASTVLWQSKIDVSVEGFSFSFNVNVGGVPATAILGKIASSSADCQVNINGYSIP